MNNNKRLELHRGDIYFIHKNIESAEDCRRIPNSDIFENDRFLKKGRPGVIISCENELRNSGNTVQVVFLTTSDRNIHLPTNVQLTTENTSGSVATCNQVNTVRRDRIGDFFGKLNTTDLDNISTAVSKNLGVYVLGECECKFLMSELEKNNEEISKLVDEKNSLKKVVNELEKRIVAQQPVEKVSIEFSEYQELISLRGEIKSTTKTNKQLIKMLKNELDR